MTPEQTDRLRQWGARADEIIDLANGSGPRRFRSISVAHANLAAVVERDGLPLLYVYDASGGRTALGLKRLLWDLACRGDAAYLAISSDKEIRFLPTGLFDELPPSVSLEVSDPQLAFAIDVLTHGTLDDLAPRPTRRQPASQGISERLRAWIGALMADIEAAADRRIAYGLVARALVIRGLADRSVSGPSDALVTPADAAAACVWLDQTFHAELPSLGQPNADLVGLFTALEAASGPLLQRLAAICQPVDRSARPVDWSGIDFAQVPASVISEVLLSTLRDTRIGPASIWRPVARFMANQAIAGLPTDRRASARLLDLACGGGLFLVEGFAWLIDAAGRDAAALDPPSVLERQVRGYDIDAEVLAVAAISLQWALLDVTGALAPPKLFGTVLKDVRDPGHLDERGAPLGSLGVIGRERDFDVVISAPPRRRAKPPAVANARRALRDGSRVPLQRRVEEQVKGIVRSREDNDHFLGGAVEVQYDHPRDALDIAFAWSAIDWAKPDAVIALVIDNRTIFEHDAATARMREMLLGHLRPTAFLDFSRLALAGSADGPAAVMFALNHRPAPDDVFRYAVASAGGLGTRWTFYADDVVPLDPAAITADPTLMVTTTNGNALDSALMARIEALAGGQLWEPRTQRLGDCVGVWATRAKSPEAVACWAATIISSSLPSAGAAPSAMMTWSRYLRTSVPRREHRALFGAIGADRSRRARCSTLCRTEETGFRAALRRNLDRRQRHQSRVGTVAVRYRQQ